MGLRVGKVVNCYKVAKHFELMISERSFSFERKHELIAAEAALDGIYVIRTSVDTQRMDASECVRGYKALANVERAFRSLKTVDLKVRPIHHRLADRVRAHILLCMLAYYVEWHIREAWRELMFADQAVKVTGDPVVAAQRSESARHKLASRTLDDGTPVHSFSTLMAALASTVRIHAARQVSSLIPIPSTSSPHPTQHNVKRWNSSRKYDRSQKAAPQFRANSLAHKGKSAPDSWNFDLTRS